MKRIALTLAAILLVAHPLFSQNEIWTTYTVSDGLASNNVMAIAIDDKGNKWLGTDNGISKFDGEVWTNYENPFGYSAHIGTIAIDKEGNIWFGGHSWGGDDFGAGVLKFDGNSWTKYDESDGLVSNNVWAINIDNEGNKWIGTMDGISKFDGSMWASYDVTMYNPYNIVLSIAIDEKNNKWFGLDGKIVMFDDSVWTEYNVYCDGVVDITIDSMGNIWAVGSSPLPYPNVYKFDGENLIPYNSFQPDHPYSIANAIAVDQEGHKWIVMEEGVSKFDDNNWSHYSTEDGLASNTVSDVAIDAEGNKWFATDNGVSKLRSASWVNIPDTAFLYALIEEGVDTNGDSLISYDEAEAVTSLDVSERGIIDMTGIEAFVNLGILGCNLNQLTSLDVSGVTALTDLSCWSNQLASLDVSGCIALIELNCTDNQLTSLDISNNTALLLLQCEFNQLTSLDVSNNTALYFLFCSGNQLTSLDVSNNTALTYLDCRI